MASEGLTIVEILVASTIVAILAIPTALFFKSFIGSFKAGEARTSVQDISFHGITKMTRDFREMNEILIGQADQLEFILDSHRLNDPGGPGYSKTGNKDGDIFDNMVDFDDDGDAWIGSAIPVAGSTVGWRQGVDLNDDDDDMDLKRDVICRYVYNQASRTLDRQMRFNEGPWTIPETIFMHVLSCRFDYFARLGTPPMPGAPPSLDLNNDQIVDQNELDFLSPGDGLTTFKETRWVSGIGYKIEIKSPRQAKPFFVQGKLWPISMEPKEKFPW